MTWASEVPGKPKGISALQTKKLFCDDRSRCLSNVLDGKERKWDDNGAG